MQFIMVNLTDGMVRTFKTYPKFQLPDHLRRHEDDVWARIEDGSGRIFPLSEMWDGKTFLVEDPNPNHQPEDGYLIALMTEEDYKKENS